MGDKVGAPPSDRAGGADAPEPATQSQPSGRSSTGAGKLLPCPFCGKSNVSTFGPYGWYRQWGISHSCPSFYSGAQEMFQGFHTEALAVAAWNKRAPDAVPEMLEALELADALLRGANMNRAVVERKVSAAIDSAKGAA